MSMCKTPIINITLRVLCVFLLLLQQMTAVHAATLVGLKVVQLTEASGSEVSDSDTIDLDPPAVEHNAITSGTAGTLQSFTVQAIDLQGIRSVTLMIRASSLEDYQAISMQRVPETNNYSASMETSADQKLLEYYFSVVDTGDNKVLNGFPYEPFKRTLEAPVAAQAPPIDAAPELAVDNVTEPVADNAEPANKNTKALIWGAVGLLVLGALAASGGSSDTPETNTSQVTTVPVMVTVPLPE